MCDIDKLNSYTEQWEDYFTYVNTAIQNKFAFEDDLYIAYGCYNNLPIEDIKYWFKDVEEFLVSSLDPVGYIEHKYGDFMLSEEDIDYFIEKEISEDMLYECGGYWFRA